LIICLWRVLLFFIGSRGSEEHGYHFLVVCKYNIMSDPVEDAEKLPLAERLDHSNWKVRQNAYEALEKKFNEAEDGVAPVFREFGNY
jgi:hypothetical protein